MIKFSNLILMEPLTIFVLIGLITLIIERIYSWAIKVKKSKCFVGEIIMNSDSE